MSVVPVTTLSALTLVKPVLNGSLVSIDSDILPITVDTDLNTTWVEVTIESVVTRSSDWTLVNGKRRFNLAPSVLPTSVASKVLVVGRNYDSQNPVGTGPFRITPTLSFDYLYTQSSSLPTIDPPSGVKVYRGATTCKIEWVKPEQLQGLLGVRVLASTDPTGITVPYTQVNSLISKISRSTNNVTSSTSTTAIDPVDSSIVTITTVQNTLPVNYSQIVIDKTTVNNADKFYIILSSVVQDPDSNHIYESNYNGPFTCGFVDLRQVSPTDFITAQQKEEIALRLITSTTQNYPDLDLTPRSELRDILIDPVSLELSEQSVREWFGRVSTSISALATVDDYDGDGFSDPLNTNPYKPIIARAWNFSEANTQALIDKQFDILGERAGLTRGGATASVVPVVIHTYSKPNSRVSIDAASTQVSSIADADTPALSFYCRGSVVIDPANANALYDPEKGWWAVTLPFECSITGSIGNVGVGAIRQVISGIPSGWFCTNLVPADFGTDGELNSRFAERIKDRLVVGVDSGRRLGYLNTARSIPGVIDANVVASGDLEMLRDWDDLRKKHTYGTVDVYVRGTASSQQTALTPFRYETPAAPGDYSSYYSLDYTSSAFDNSNIGKKQPSLQFRVRDFASLEFPIIAVIDMLAIGNSGVINLGTKKVKIDPTNGTINLDPNEIVYRIANPGTIGEYEELYTLNGNYVNNQTFIASLASSVVEYKASIRLASPLALVPTNQPVTKIYTIAGDPDKTNVVSPSLHRLIKRDDPLLVGFSSRSTDQIRVDSSTLISPPPVKTIQFTGVDLNVGSLNFTSKKITRSFGSWLDDGLGIGDTIILANLPVVANNRTFTIASVTAQAITTLEAPTPATDQAGKVTFIPVVPIDTAMVLNTTGNIWSVRKSDLSAIYSYGTSASGNDYTIVPLDRYGSYGIRRLSTSTIPLDTDILVSYDKYNMSEYCSFVEEDVLLVGLTPSKLSRPGFIKNIWIPESYGLTTLSMDGWNIDPLQYTPNSLCAETVAKKDRYIKITYNSKVMKENQDYTLKVDATSGEVTITRVAGGRIPQDSAYVHVQYFVNETFSITTGYPGYVNQVVDSIEISRHAAGDILVKDMIGNAVDVEMTVELSSNASADIMDSRIRTTIGVVLDNAKGRLTQSELIRQVKSINGVSNVIVPLTKFAKSNGSYNVGVVIPTGTVWNKVENDPLFAGKNLGFPPASYITASSVLADNTLPSGGLKDSFVGLLYEGEAYTRTLSIDEFRAAGSGAFYIIGQDDYFMSGNIQIPTAGTGRILISMKADTAGKATSNPAYNSFRVTYQVWEDGGTKDITLSPTEYLKSGRITINYILNQ